MKTLKYLMFAAAAVVISTSAFASPEGDAVKGKKEFRKCSVCHSLDEGKKKVGPSLFNIIDATAGGMEGYKYSKDMLEAGKNGLKWTPETMIAYLENPKKYLAAFLKKDKARSKMINKFKKLSTRQNITAYLVSLQPKKEEAEKKMDAPAEKKEAMAEKKAEEKK